MYRHVHAQRFQQLDFHRDMGFTENAWEVQGSKRRGYARLFVDGVPRSIT